VQGRDEVGLKVPSSEGGPSENKPSQVKSRRKHKKGNCNKNN